MADETPRLWICEACGASLQGAPGLKCPFCGHVHERGQQPPGAEAGTAHAGLVDESQPSDHFEPVAEATHEPAPEAEPQPEPVAPVVDHVEAPAPPPSAPVADPTTAARAAAEREASTSQEPPA